MDTTKLSSELFKSTEYNELKSKVHNRLIEIIDLSILSSLDQAVLRVEIKKVVDRIIAENGASTMKDMGKIMGIANKELSGQADNKLISTIVKELLSK